MENHCILMKILISIALVLYTLIVGAGRMSWKARRDDLEGGGENGYKQVLGVADQIIKVLSDKAVRRFAKVSAWGAFTYGLVKSAEVAFAQYDLCMKDRRDPQGNCAVESSGLAANLSITVAGLVAGVSTYGQKCDLGSMPYIAHRWQSLGYGIVDVPHTRRHQTGNLTGK